MLNVICVLKSGGDYGPGDVYCLAEGVRQHLAAPYRLICLTDMGELIDPRPMAGEESLEILPLAHNLPGWWSKLEIFTIEGAVLYLDLDTVIVGSLDDLAEAVRHLEGRFMMLRKWKGVGWGSGIMGWQGDWSGVLRSFLAQRKRFERRPRGWDMRINEGTNAVVYRGDQDWLSIHLENLSAEIKAAQDLCPGIYSYKRQIQGNGMPVDARVIVFHGRPRPAEVQL